MMVNRICALVIISLFACALSTPLFAKTPWTKAEVLGKTVYNNLRDSSKSDSVLARESEVLQLIRSAGLACQGDYQAISIVGHNSDEDTVFLILTPQEKGIQFGRHFKVRFKHGTKDIIDVSYSSSSCFFVPAPGYSIPFTRHKLSDEPNEFHVFLSLLNDTEIMVSTRKGLWSIKDGKIVLVDS